jgi:Putative phage serine protease XkdF
MIRLFNDLIKDATAQGVHAVTALGNVSTKDKDKKQLDFNQAIAEQSTMSEAKDPDVGLTDDPEATGDIVHQQKKWALPLKIMKTDAEQQLIFGWASVVEKDGVAVIDKQGDIIPVEELENAAYDFTLYSRDGGDMHDRRGVAKLVESMVFTTEKQKALGIDLKQVGWWVGFKVTDKELWAAHKRGERPEFSIGGAAVPTEVE